MKKQANHIAILKKPVALQIPIEFRQSDKERTVSVSEEGDCSIIAISKNPEVHIPFSGEIITKVCFDKKFKNPDEVIKSFHSNNYKVKKISFDYGQVVLLETINSAPGNSMAYVFLKSHPSEPLFFDEMGFMDYNWGKLSLQQSDSLETNTTIRKEGSMGSIGVGEDQIFEERAKDGSLFENRPLTEEEAKRWAEQIINNNRNQKMVITRTEEKPDGWIFYYTSEQNLKTSDKNEQVPGNLPLYIRKDRSFEYITNEAR